MNYLVFARFSLSRGALPCGGDASISNRARLVRMRDDVFFRERSARPLCDFPPMFTRRKFNERTSHLAVAAVFRLSKVRMVARARVKFPRRDKVPSQSTVKCAFHSFIIYSDR